MPAQLLVGFTPGGIMPVHVDVTVWPGLDGTVSELVGGVEATLDPARSSETVATIVASNSFSRRETFARAKA
jgi:hypothetical protein